MSQCWLCGSAESSEFLPATMGREVTSGDFKISDSHYGRTARLVKCLRCGFRYADPLPAEDLVRLYTGLVDQEYSEGSAGRIRPFRQILRRCRALLPEARTVLDIGASTGLLCLAAKEQGLEAVGVEPSEWAVEVARNRHHADVLLGTFPHPGLKGRQFHIVTLIDVIEHVSDPAGLLNEIASVLMPGGLVVITTPDVASIAARVMGRKWWHYRVAHVCFFDRRTMSRAAARAGLEVVRTERYRWVFPVGYIAVRLERYLPVGPLRKALTRSRAGRTFLEWTIPVNLHDSTTYYARKARSKSVA